MPLGNVRVGTQGWNYEAWEGPFYPAGTRPSDFLSVYARAFDTVEVDSTFYAIPALTTFQSWAERTPPGFAFALKLPQEITHEQRLRDATGATELFFERARALGSKLGPTLVQLGPDLAPSELPALVAFLQRLPRDVQVAVEFRHRGWMNDGIYALLREHNVALALVEGRWIPRKTMLALAQKPTADFAYIRFMGPNRDIVDYSRVQADRTREIELWRNALISLAASVTMVYAYVNNHFAGHGPASARDIQRAVGQTPVAPDTIGEQLLLF